MDQIRNPNIAGNFQQGLQFGQQQKAYQQQQADNAALRGLAPQVIAGDAGAYDQAAAISPEAANAYQGAGDNQLRRLKGFITYVDQARAAGRPEAVNAALQAGSGFIGRFIGKPGPTEWTPDMEPGWEQLKARIAMLDQAGTQGRVQSTYVDGQGNRVAIMADGTQKVLGPNDEGMSNQTITVTGADGKPRQMTFNKRTGTYMEAGQGEPPPQAPPQITGPDGIPIDVSGVTDPNVRASIQANPGAYNAAPDGSTAQLPPVNTGPSAFVGRSPEEQAALTEQAKTGVQLANLPTELGLRTNAAVDQAVRIEQGKNTAEKAAAAPAVIATMQNSLDSIDALLSDPELGSIVGLSGMNPLNRIPGSKARGLIARAEQVAGQAFLAAFNQLKGGGAITEREGAAATAAMARLDRSQSEEDYRAALTDLKAAISPAIERARQQALGGVRQQGPQPGTVQDGYRFRGGNPADPNSWERL
jgi:hypothetical protein